MQATTANDAAFLRYEPCPSCGSRDNLGRYTDGHGWCFGCSYYEPGEGQIATERVSKKLTFTPIEGVSPRPIQSRRLAKETCVLWEYAAGELEGVKVAVANARDPYGVLVGQRIRYPDKTFKWRGDTKAAGLFGQHLWRDKGRMVVITEGVEDAMSVSQVQNNKWPVVSLKNGTGGAKKEIQAALEWLEGFETVVLMFDMDEPGRKAVEEVAPLFTPGKVKIARLPLKDASDMLVAGRGSEIVDAIWGAKAYRPDGILTGSDLWERIEKKAPPGAPLPWLALSGLTLGVRPGEVITLTAGSGIGKSSLVREVIFHHHSQGEAVGLIALEESVERSALALMGLHLNKRLHLGIEDIPAAEKREAFEATVGSGRMFFYDHFGSTALDNLLSRIRYMAKGCGCKFIALDHLSIVVSGMAEGDERRMIDNAMTALKSLAMECQVVLYLVVHLRRTNDDSTHEEGGQVRASHLRGSHSILQLSDTVIAAERNQQDEKLKNITQLRLLKARWTGASGVAGWLEYDENSGRLVELFEDPFRSKSKLKDNEDGSMVESPF